MPSDVPDIASAADCEGNPVTDEATLKRAFNAFKKKVKHLLAEQQGGGKYGIGGRDRGVEAVTPPPEFPAEVWEALADQGKLKREGRGLYSIPKPGAPRGGGI
jgi:hypothetical protein